jgi:ketosteroid isomerase-like protein
LDNPVTDAINSITQYFRALEQETIAGNFSALAERFSETFLAASPGGARLAQRSVFAQMLPARKEQFEKMGKNSTKLVSLETTEIDARYTLAKTRWQLTFTRDGQSSQVVFADSTYIVDRGAEPFQIILYLTSQDLPKVLAERGIAPS